jgi:hypothetical protein
MHYVEHATGEVPDAEIFLTVLGASQLIYVEAIKSQQLQDWIWANENAWQYYGGATKGICPDNLKSAVTKACNYEPLLNTTYNNLARHYRTVILRTRPVKPKDKPLVESGAKIVYQRIFAPRNQTFFSLQELNQAIRQRLELVNNTPFQQMEINRRELFNEIEENELQALPSERYEIRQYQVSRVEFHHHICLKEDKHYYSIPYQYTGRKVKTIYTGRMIEIYHDNILIALHKLSYKTHGCTTNKEYMCLTNARVFFKGMKNKN